MYDLQRIRLPTTKTVINVVGVERIDDFEYLGYLCTYKAVGYLNNRVTRFSQMNGNIIRL